MRRLRAISAEAGQGIESSLPDTPNGKCSLLLATALTMESLPASTKVVEPSTGWITLGCRPVEFAQGSTSAAGCPPKAVRMTLREKSLEKHHFVYLLGRGGSLSFDTLF
jgi:hypothetical protein